MPPPLKLYKYVELSVRTLQNLKSQVLYFGSPRDFNDSYDCAQNPIIQQPSDKEVEELRQHFLHKQSAGADMIAQLQSLSSDDLRQELIRSTQTAIAQKVDWFLRTCGVTCFSEAYDNLLMWSHYGGRYKGVCLEFATTWQAFVKCKKVNYLEGLPSTSVSSWLIDDAFDSTSELFANKSKSWSYECEWRAYHAKAGTKYVYDPSLLTGIYFGPDVEREMLEIVCLILAGQNEQVQFWKGSLSTTEYKVVFTPFTYTSHLEAKRKGLIDNLLSTPG